jgi:hypothetical protein
VPTNNDTSAGAGNASNNNFSVSAPQISLPKGGGAIRGLGEKFAANLITGTGAMTVPIATSEGRGEFGANLSLSYDSSTGNDIFGLGWTLSLPAITRKTDKGLPRYRDLEDSDVFILSGAEDLVPLHRQDLDGTWVAAHPGYQRDADSFLVRDPSGRLLVHEDELDGYRVRRYRPRIESLFARIERWSKIGAPSDVHWRSLNAVPMPCATIQDNNALDTNSGPLSLRRNAGGQRALTRRDSTAITRGERMRPSTSIASPSLVNSSVTVRHLSCWPLAQ